MGQINWFWIWVLVWELVGGHGIWWEEMGVSRGNGG